MKQILRSGTSVGANVSEGQFTQTKADFLTRSGVATMNGETALEILITNSMLMPLPTMLYWDRVGGKGEVIALEWLEQPEHCCFRSWKRAGNR